MLKNVKKLRKIMRVQNKYSKMKILKEEREKIIEREKVR